MKSRRAGEKAARAGLPAERGVTAADPRAQPGLTLDLSRFMERLGWRAAGSMRGLGWCAACSGSLHACGAG